MEGQTERAYVPLPSNFSSNMIAKFRNSQQLCRTKSKVKLVLLLTFFVKNVIYAKVLPSRLLLDLDK